jgi:scyllo-inositol 2-dehydrogenase (NADP+)
MEGTIVNEITRDPVRVALVGYGLGGQLQAPLIDVTDGLQLTAVVTTNAERVRALGVKHPGARAVTRLRDVLGEVELVVIETPNPTHVELAREALNAGCHVAVDKPVCASSREAWELVHLASATGRVFSVVHQRRWDDDYLTASKVVREQRLGQVDLFEWRWDRWHPEVRVGAWREDPEQDGGMLLDLGSHGVDQAVQLLGPVRSVYAELDCRRPGARVDDTTFLALEHEGGARSHLSVSVHGADSMPRMRIVSRDATFVSTGLDPQDAAVLAGTSPNDPAFGLRETPDWASLHDGDGAHPVDVVRGDWRAFYRGLHAAIRDGAPPPVTGADGAGVVTLLEHARRSATERRVIDLAS